MIVDEIKQFLEQEQEKLTKELEQVDNVYPRQSVSLDRAYLRGCINTLIKIRDFIDKGE